ncbi:MAG: hypothetical protein EBZ74_08415 [Planctomycetia bacterium]|nr:hypothetical protein [Planctomycetia bacterium]
MEIFIMDYCLFSIIYEHLLFICIFLTKIVFLFLSKMHMVDNYSYGVELLLIIIKFVNNNCHFIYVKKENIFVLNKKKKINFLLF